MSKRLPDEVVAFCGVACITGWGGKGSSAMLTTLVVLFTVAQEIGASDVFEEKRSPLDYPQRITIPDDVPSIARAALKDPTQRPTLIFPIAIYSRQHYEGWQRCLYEFGMEDVPICDLKWKPPILSVDEPYTFRAREDGFNACKHLIVEQIAIRGIEKVRAMARDSHSPIVVQAPKPP